MKSDQSCRVHDASVYALVRSGLVRWAVLAMICFGLVGPAQAAEKPDAKKASTAASAPEAKLPNDDVAIGMLSRAKPSDRDNIAVLKPLEGIWDYTESLWTSPKDRPEQATGTVTNEMVMDQRFLSSKAKGSLNIGREQVPYEGQELIGFDNAKKSFSFVAVDTLTTGMTTGSGEFEGKAGIRPETGKLTTTATDGNSKTDEKKSVLKEAGRFTNPLTGMEQDFQSELTFVDADHYTRTIFAVHKSGRDTKLIEFDYTKRK